MKAFTVIETTDPRCTGYVKALSWCGGIEYIPRDIWERESLATADTRDPDFYDRHNRRSAVVGIEAEYAGATITVETGRDMIDPQGIASDEEAAACEAHILDAVREAFPGAGVRAVGRGGRTGGCMADGTEFDDDVKRIVDDALSSFMGG
jgi:hypothetical protein